MSGTTDQVIDDTIGDLIAELQDGGWASSDAEQSKLSEMVSRLIEIRTQLRNGRGDDWMGLADPVDNLALAAYRADAIMNKEMTPPNWDFANDAVKESWRAWAWQAVKEM